MRFGLLVLAAALPLPALAADLPDTLDGTWSAVGDAQPRIDAAVDRVVDEMSFIKRPFARVRLEKATAPCNEVLIWETAQGEVAVQCDDLPPAIGPLDGTQVPYTAYDGEDYALSYHLTGGALVQVFHDPAGIRRIVYDARGDRLTLEVTLSSDQLPEDIVYVEEFQAS